ncbi:MAG: septation protein A [Hyphomicrobiaceae bacterium]
MTDPSRKPTTADTTPAAPATEVDKGQLLKMLVEIGPLVVFFAVNYATKNLFLATGIFMVSTAISLGVSYRMFGRLPPMLLVSSVLVFVLGGMTLWLQEATFIKLKPTIVYSLFAIVLLSGLAFGKHYLRLLIGEVFKLSPQGWKILTFRWAAFFLGMAVLNEIVWRNFSDDFWIAFKLVGAIPLTIVFGVAQLSLMKRYAETDATVG